MLDLRDYLCRNQVALRNYAQDRRNGLRISSVLAESAMSHLVNERMGKRQPMRWSAEGAHLLLQVRCAVLDNRLEMLFREWLPKFRRQTPPPRLIGCAPRFDTVPLATQQASASHLLPRCLFRGALLEVASAGTLTIRRRDFPKPVAGRSCALAFYRSILLRLSCQETAQGRDMQHERYADQLPYRSRRNPLLLHRPS